MAYEPLPELGQDDMAGSLPVVIASDQSAVPVSGTVTANIGTVATLATAAKQDTGNTALAAIETATELIDDAIYTDGTGTPSKGIAIMGSDGTNPQLVTTDSSGDLQIDVKTMPTTTVTATNLDIRDLTNTDVVTAELSAVDNAVLDTIDAVLDTIKTDTAAMVTDLAAIEVLLGTIDTDTGNMDTSLNNIEAGYAAEGAALGSGVLLQGDDGTDRKNINVDATTGDVQVDITHTVTVDGSGVTQPVSGTVTANLAAGTNNIGDVDILSIAAGDNNIGNVDIASIAAGDNNIGNVDIASAIPAGTNNIGDVDIASITNASINGPGVPVIDSYTQASFNLTAAANQVLVASAASKQIWVYGFGFTVNAAGTVSFQDQDDTAITGIMPFAANGGMAVSPSGNFAMPVWKLGTDKDLEVDVVTSELDGWISYAIVSV